MTEYYIIYIIFYIYLSIPFGGVSWSYHMIQLQLLQEAREFERRRRAEQRALDKSYLLLYSKGLNIIVSSIIDSYYRYIYLHIYPSCPRPTPLKKLPSITPSPTAGLWSTRRCMMWPSSSNFILAARTCCSRSRARRSVHAFTSTTHHALHLIMMMHVVVVVVAVVTVVTVAFTVACTHSSHAHTHCISTARCVADHMQILFNYPTSFLYSLVI